VKPGFEILDSLEELNREFIEKYGIEIDIGIGIHSGKCRVGNMGSMDLFDYTIIGDNVNLASRLEGLTKFYGVRLIVSEEAMAGAKEEVSFQELDRVTVKGRKEPVGVFTVNPHRGAESLAQELADYEKALGLYQKRAFDQGLKVFTNLASRFPDTKLYQIYQDRCAYFLSHPPDPEWDGVFMHKSK
jgi:adenylate cyclase